MKNYGILKYNNVGVDDFTSNIGLELRKKINPLLRRLLKLAVKGELIVDRYPKLEKDKPYIFDRFYCADKSHTDKFHFGLGLSIAKELAQSLSAEIGFTDTKNG